MTNVHFVLKPARRANGAGVGRGRSMPAPPHLPLHDGEEMRERVNMTPYEEAQFRAADRMRCIRELVTQFDNLHPNASRTTRAELSRKIRGAERQVKLEMQEAKRLAQAEERHQEFDLLFSFFKDTRDLIRERFSGGLPVGQMGDGVQEEEEEEEEEKKDATALTTDSDMALHRCLALSAEAGNVPPGSAGGYDIHNDEEFMQFFLNTRKNDVDIDDALGRISSGVQRLNENALQITSEIVLQERMLDDTELKVHSVHGRLHKLNKKLKDTLKKMDRPMAATYFLFCLTLLVIIGVIYFLATS